MPKVDTPAKPAARPATGPTHNRVEFPADGSWFTPLEETEDFVNILYYGKEGVGKTTHAVSAANRAPEGSRVLVLRAEGGLKLDALRRRGIDTSKIMVFPPKSGDKITRAQLDGIYRRVQADLAQDPKSWYAVVWDSITEIVVTLVEEAQTKRIQQMQRKGLMPDEDFVDRDDYGVMTKVMRDLLRKYRDLDCHFILTALERRDVDADTSKPTYGPAVTPGLQTDLLGYVDLVLMCKPAEDERPARALTRANGRYRAKDRFNVLPRTLAEPTFARVIDYLDDLLHAENDPEQANLHTPVQEPTQENATQGSTEGND